MADQSTHTAEVTQHTLAYAHELGFELAAVAPASPPSSGTHYQEWIEHGYHGKMAYLARPDALARRLDLGCTLPGIRSVLIVGANYYSDALPVTTSQDPSRGLIARYAWGDDYHEVLGRRLRRLAEFLACELGAPPHPGHEWRAYVDTAPVLERDLARSAGIGFVGKNTNLIHPRLGSWLFLGELLLTTELEPARSYSGQVEDQGTRRMPGTCGDCTRCLAACPTGALVAPFVLDARRCISYLTIELKGPIPVELRPLLGNRIFGCDVCQEVCPWNRRFARPTPDPAFQLGAERARGLPIEERLTPRLLDLLALDASQFRRRFERTPILRAKRRGLLRNAAVALGNWADPSVVPPLTQALQDPEPLVRSHAAWALGRIATWQAQKALEKALGAENDREVRDELHQALGRT